MWQAKRLINLGAIRYDLGHYVEAEQFDRQALDIVQSWYGEDNPETATDLTILARALVFQQRFDEASDLLQKSLAIKERAFGKVHPSVASTLNELGSVALKEGNYDAAEQYFKRTAEIYRSVYGEHHYLLAPSLSNLASVYMARQDWSSAEKLFWQAIPILGRAKIAHRENCSRPAVFPSRELRCARADSPERRWHILHQFSAQLYSTAAGFMDTCAVDESHGFGLPWMTQVSAAPSSENWSEIPVTGF